MAPSTLFLLGFNLLLAASSTSLCNGFVSPSPKIAPLTVKPSDLSSLHLFPETASDVHFLDSVSTLLSDAVGEVPQTGGVSYSKYSYYTVLGLYLFSFPGLWSTIKRSTKAKIKRKTYVT